MAKTFKTSVQRYNPDNDDAPYFQEFDVEYEPGMTVLDALLYIQDKFDSSLAFRWECRGGQCGACAVKVNTIARIACRTKVNPEKALFLEPLDKMPVIKDLVTDMAQTTYRIVTNSHSIQKSSMQRRLRNSEKSENASNVMHACQTVPLYMKLGTIQVL